MYVLLYTEIGVEKETLGACEGRREVTGWSVDQNGGSFDMPISVYRR